MVFKNIKIEKRKSFLDFIFGGCEISLHINVDFTKSNKDPTDPKSLHQLYGNNQYEQSIRSIGNILIPYDNDQKIPIYGFYGKLNIG